MDCTTLTRDEQIKENQENIEQNSQKIQDNSDAIDVIEEEQNVQDNAILANTNTNTLQAQQLSDLQQAFASGSQQATLKVENQTPLVVNTGTTETKYDFNLSEGPFPSGTSEIELDVNNDIVITNENTAGYNFFGAFIGKNNSAGLQASFKMKLYADALLIDEFQFDLAANQSSTLQTKLKTYVIPSGEAPKTITVTYQRITGDFTIENGRLNCNSNFFLGAQPAPTNTENVSLTQTGETESGTPTTQEGANLENVQEHINMKTDILSNANEVISLELNKIDKSDATSSALTNSIMKRDANGRADVAEPVTDSNIATKRYVDDNSGGEPTIEYDTDVSTTVDISSLDDAIYSTLATKKIGTSATDAVSITVSSGRRLNVDSVGSSNTIMSIPISNSTYSSVISVAYNTIRKQPSRFTGTSKYAGNQTNTGGLTAFDYINDTLSFTAPTGYIIKFKKII